MKILMMVHFPLAGSGSGVYTLNIANSLTKQGHEVCIIIPENQRPEEHEGIRIHPVYFNGYTAEALPFNFPCFTTHPRSLQTFYDLSDAELKCYEKAFREAIEYEIDRFQPDIIHAGHAWLLPKYAADYNIPVVITVHGTDLIGYQKTDRFKEDVHAALGKCAKIITISKDNDRLVNELFSQFAQKSELILNGYNPDVFYVEDLDRRSVLHEFGIDRDFAHVISFAGKFAHFKGIDILLKGAKEFLRDDTCLVIAGDGELFDDMTALAADLGLENAFFIHNQPHERLRRLYNIADISLLTSRKEPFGLVIIEAMACGTPIVASDDGGAVDILTPDVGLLFESENPQDLADKVNSILDGKAAFDRDLVAHYAQERFSQDNSIHRLVAIYEEAVSAQ